MTKKRLQLYYTDEMMTYLNRLSEQRSADGHYNSSIAGIGSEILELGFKVHKLQQQDQENKSPEFDLKAFFKDLAEYIINASTFSKGAYVVSDKISRNEENNVTAEQLNEAVNKHLSLLMDKHFKSS